MTLGGRLVREARISELGAARAASVRAGAKAAVGGDFFTIFRRMHPAGCGPTSARGRVTGGPPTEFALLVRTQNLCGAPPYKNLYTAPP